MLFDTKPQFVVYQEIHETSRMYMKSKETLFPPPPSTPLLIQKFSLVLLIMSLLFTFADVTAIEAEWLPVYSRSLCSLSDPLESPAPYYDGDKDLVMCYVTGTFGPHGWQIPVTPIEYPSTSMKYKLFAQALLDGKVIDSLAEFTDKLLTKASILLKPWARLQPKTFTIANVLESEEICTRRKLMKKLQKQNDCKYPLTHYAIRPPLIFSPFLSSVRQQF